MLPGSEGRMTSLRRTAFRLLVVFLFAAALLLAACGGPGEVEPAITLQPSGQPTTISQEPTPTPEPEETLFVCLNQQPESLYIYSEAFQYGPAHHEANAILEALYDGPFDVLDYTVVPVILDRLPSLENGDVAYDVVTVAEGEVFFNPETLQPENLTRGSAYLPAGCRSTDCIAAFEGGEVDMLQMRVDFHLLPGLTWSDGESLDAYDSAFSFELDRASATPTTKYLVARTESYSALDDVTTRWLGIPGYVDTEFETLFWTPLPRHQLDTYSAADILALELANVTPLGWGAYQIEGWEGDGLVLTANPRYFRADEGLPAFDRLVFRFLGEDETAAVQQLVTGECDLVDESLLSGEALPALQVLEEDGVLELIWTPGAEVERIDFNLLRTNGDENGLSFADLRLRTAIASCIDREALLTEVLQGFGLVSDSFLSPQNPAAVTGLEALVYQPEVAEETLDQLGWVDEDGDAATPRVARGVLDNLFGTPLSFELVYSPGNFHQPIAERIQDDLGQCGVEVVLREMEQRELSSPWPEGYVFGGQYEAVLWAWPDWMTPFCEMYAGWERPSDENPYGSNASGYENSAYNGACRAALLGLPSDETSSNPQQIYQSRFAEDLPSLPLFVRPRFLVHAPALEGVSVDAVSFSLLWNLEEYRLAE